MWKLCFLAASMDNMVENRTLAWRLCMYSANLCAAALLAL